MQTLHLWVILSLIFSAVLFRFIIPDQKKSSIVLGTCTLPLLFLLALCLRIVLAAGNIGFDVDMTCFSAWANRMADLGPGAFYAEDYFSDYPPLYLYCLGIIGKIVKHFSVAYYSPAHLILLKLPAILSDLGIGFLLYKAGRKHLGVLSGTALAALYLFQPVVIMNSCLWGQIDSVFTFILLLVCVLLEREAFLPAYLFYGAGILLKPQMLIFAPLIIASVVYHTFQPTFSSKRMLITISYGLLAIILTVLAASPFGLEKVVLQYTDTLSSYPYATVNAYNFWAALGYNWAHQDTVFLGLTCSSWGTIAIVSSVIFCFIIGYCFRKVSCKYSLMGAFLILTVFTFSVRMHERYLYPIMGLMLLSYPGLASRQYCSDAAANQAGSSKKSVQGLAPSLKYIYPGLFAVITALHFYNTGHILYYYNPGDFSADKPIIKLTGLGTFLCALFFYELLARLYQAKEGLLVTAGAAVIHNTKSSGSIGKSKDYLQIPLSKTNINRTDLLLMICITVFYSLFALHDLGENKGPETVYTAVANQPIALTFPDNQKPVSFAYFIAPEHGRDFLLTCDDAPESTCRMENVFTWNTIDLPMEAQNVCLTPTLGESHIIELLFYNSAGQQVRPINADAYPELFDEANLCPETFSFRNSMYFDEIYHARTAYEFLHDLRSYENTHPPFGKVLISLGVALFGMNAFGWRIAGTVFGILMLPVLYLFAKRFLGSSAFAAFTCWIFAFDFMHFTQTRIATIDVYIVFFIICMYYFLYRYISSDYYGSFKSLLIPLTFCGISMGFGIASKWTGVYAGIGMGLLFFLHLGQQTKQYLSASKRPSGKTNGHSNKEITADFPVRTKKLILYCLLFFVFVPSVIYVLSYIPFRDNANPGLFARMLANQQTMFSYHSGLEATHYFASPYYEWPLLIRPIWFYSRVVTDTIREGISSFGNPLVWWAGIPAFFYMIYLFFSKKDQKALYLIIGYLAQYVPWFFVTRITFIYHYFPCVVFIVLMIGYTLRNLLDTVTQRKKLFILIGYAAAVFGLFLLFYPVLSGEPVALSYVHKYLKWLQTWVLVAG